MSLCPIASARCRPRGSGFALRVTPSPHKTKGGFYWRDCRFLFFLPLHRQYSSTRNAVCSVLYVCRPIIYPARLYRTRSTGRHRQS